MEKVNISRTILLDRHYVVPFMVSYLDFSIPTYNRMLKKWRARTAVHTAFQIFKLLATYYMNMHFPLWTLCQENCLLALKIPIRVQVNLKFHCWGKLGCYSVNIARRAIMGFCLMLKISELYLPLPRKRSASTFHLIYFKC